MEAGDDMHKEKGYTISNYGQSLSTDNKKIVFTFDKTYSENADQKRIWPEAKRVIKSTIEFGCNGAIICYG